MNRRDLLRAFATVGVAGVGPGLLSWKAFGQGPVRYEVRGVGPALFVGPPIGATKQSPGTDPLATVRQGYLDRLTDRYRVILIDYPPIGGDARAVADSFTPDRVCADILAVADAVGADRFAWYGYSWGGVVGLQLAARTNRLTALACGGWPPLGEQYKDMTAVAEILAQRAGGVEPPLMVTFYRALEQWRDEDAVPRFTCPRLAFAGSDDVITVEGYITRIGPLVRERRTDLERMGWTVRLVDGFRHELFTRPDVVVPLLREFLDPILLKK